MPTVNNKSDSDLHVKPPRVAGFTPMEMIHEGGCGTIYRARQDRLGRVVALKLLAEWPPPTDMALERFNRAAYVSAQAPHPNLVTLYDTGTAEGFHYASMEYLNGQTLQKHLSVVGMVDEPFATSAAVDALRALSALHSREICHRNVKPKNMFMETDGNVRLIGLGLASCRTAFFSPHLDARPIGTPHFMSPEMIRGSYSDPRSDLYSLGVTLFVLVTGVTPFEKGSPLAVMSRHLTDEAVSLAKTRPGLSPEFVAFVETLMARDVDHRFQSARAALEVGEMLEKRFAGRARLHPEMQPMPRPAPTPEYPLAKPRKFPHPALIALAAALGTVMLMFGLWWLVAGQHRPGNPGDPAATEPGAPVQLEGTEKARFDSLLRMSDPFHTDPAGGADAWASYLREFPRAPASRREIASRMLDFYLNLDEARQKPKPVPKGEHLDF